MPTSLPRSTPADQRVDPAAILSFLDAVDERPDIEMHSLMVIRHGQVVAEGWWAPYSAERPQLLYSLSKSFTSTAAAFAQAEGLLDLDDEVVSHFAEFAADTVIATTACTLDMQAVLDAMWDRLLPGLGTVSPGAAAQDCPS